MNAFDIIIIISIIVVVVVVVVMIVVNRSEKNWQGKSWVCLNLDYGCK